MYLISNLFDTYIYLSTNIHWIKYLTSNCFYTQDLVDVYTWMLLPYE